MKLGVEERRKVGKYVKKKQMKQIMKDERKQGRQIGSRV